MSHQSRNATPPGEETDLLRPPGTSPFGGGNIAPRVLASSGGSTIDRQFPLPGMELTHILVVSDFERSVDWYKTVLGANLHRTYGGTSAVFDFNGVWLLVVLGGEPTADKPSISFVAPADPNSVSHSFTIRVPSCQQAYDTLVARGAIFLTPPYDWGGEIRCFFRDPDGHLFEISEIPQ